MLYGFLLFIFVILVIFMILIIMIQQPRSAGLGSFLGSAETVFGPKGTVTFFTKLTAGIGAAFMILSFILSLINRPATSGSAIEEAIKKGDIMKQLPVQPQQPKK
ncbi:MAG: preprotein translocase subunit SecG [candidate division WOR-3 bacterium]|nr:preprotein translocase subunit SecG [candidate division WOR-3 bacterium]MCX7948136.1 preprotein translocase subunit SecG [candidate division WOR-3 bacterium]MDW8151055.1 preprotein translocase subunit SecG [candidate division WOR-3 bacterium]